MTIGCFHLHLFMLDLSICPCSIKNSPLACIHFFRDQSTSGNIFHTFQCGNQSYTDKMQTQACFCDLNLFQERLNLSLGNTRLNLEKAGEGAITLILSISKYSVTMRALCAGALS